MKTMLLVHAEAALAALPLAERVAERTGRPLILLCVSTAPMPRLDPCADGQDPPTALVQSALLALAGRSGPDVPVFLARGPSPHRAVLDALDELAVSRLIVSEAFSEIGLSQGALVGRVARAAPVDLLLIEPLPAAASPERVLFLQLRDGGGLHGLELSARAFADAETLMHVVPADRRAKRRVDRPTDGRTGRRTGRGHRLFRRFHEALPEATRDRVHWIEEPDGGSEDLVELIEAGDLLMFDVDGPGEWRRIGSTTRRIRSTAPDTPLAVGVTRSAKAAGVGWLERLAERFRRHVPKLDREQRLQLNERLATDGRLSADYLLMLVISASIAALGLIQNSTAVVIGAMLVAPLMIPILAMGMALVQANLALFRAGLQATALGVGAAFLAAAAIGMTSPWDDLSAEIAARAGPNLFDLGIALLSGIAAAYALARTRLAGTMVGVAVAVALVPPLAASGIATVKNEYVTAFGAAMLFATNLCAIVLGAGLVFRLFGMDVALRGGRAPAWARASVAGFSLMLLAISALLVHNLSQQMHEGIHRPYARPLPPELRAQIRERVGREPGIEILLMAESDIEHGFGTEVVLAVDGSAPEGLQSELLRMIRRERGMHTPVRVLLVQTAPGPIEKDSFSLSK